MKILMQNRLTAFSSMGGDTIQMIKTKQYLEKAGIRVDISLEKSPNLNGYDLIHVFNIQDCAARYSYRQIINAKKRGYPVALSPIYWDWDNSEIIDAKNELLPQSIGKKPKVQFRKANPVILFNDFFEKMLGVRIKSGNSVNLMINEALRNKESEFIVDYQLSSLLLTDGLFPNAYQELEIIKSKFDIDFKNYFVIPNAAEKNIKQNTADEFSTRLGIENYIICVGRIEPTKNQLNMVKAMEGIDIPLVFIGKKEPGYYELCRKSAKKNVFFLDEISHEQLYGYYFKAKVHALPSWRETPGLVNLEAGLAGCNLVVTNRGSTKEYFGDLVFYCDPADIATIRNAVLKAYNSPRNPKLSEYIEKNFTWERAAEKTLKGYKEILEKI